MLVARSNKNGAGQKARRRRPVTGLLAVAGGALWYFRAELSPHLQGIMTKLTAMLP
jgi:hypothetical protein